MKYLVSITAFVLLAAAGSTVLAGTLLTRYGDLAQVTEVTHKRTETEKKSSSETPASTGATNASAGQVQSTTTSTTRVSPPPPVTTTQTQTTPVTIPTTRTSDNGEIDD